MNHVDEVITENIVLNTEEMDLLLNCIDSLVGPAPSDAFIQAVISKTEMGSIKGVLKIRSAAGIFDIEVTSSDLGSLISLLKTQAHESIQNWKLRRFE